MGRWRHRLFALYRDKAERDAYNKAYYHKHKKRLIAQQQLWVKAHPESVYRSSQKKYKERRVWIAELKNHPCVDCGLRYPCYVMHFDHVRGVKLHNVSTMVRFPKQKVLDEIAKCDLVCANCHAVRTYTRGEAKRATKYQ